MEFTVAVRCRHCGLKYRAHPTKAQCPKCKCPANRPLPTKMLLLSGMVPPFSLIQAFLSRKEAPLAAFQALLSGIVGSSTYGLAYLIITRLID